MEAKLELDPLFLTLTLYVGQSAFTAAVLAEENHKTEIIGKTVKM